MKNQNKQDTGVNPVVAAAAGAIVGAGVAVAGALALNDEKNRKKVKEVLENVKSKAQGYIDNGEQHEQDKKSDLADKFELGKEKVKKTASSAKESLKLDAKEAAKTVDKSIKRGL